MSRIKLTDDFQSAVMKMSEGNPGPFDAADREDAINYIKNSKQGDRNV